VVRVDLAGVFFGDPLGVPFSDESRSFYTRLRTPLSREESAGNGLGLVVDTDDGEYEAVIAVPGWSMCDPSDVELLAQANAGFVAIKSGRIMACDMLCLLDDWAGEQSIEHFRAEEKLVHGVLAEGLYAATVSTYVRNSARDDPATKLRSIREVERRMTEACMSCILGQTSDEELRKEQEATQRYYVPIVVGIRCDLSPALASRKSDSSIEFPTLDFCVEATEQFIRRSVARVT
jgi:hypothetical protein